MGQRNRPGSNTRRLGDRISELEQRIQMLERQHRQAPPARHLDQEKRERWQ